MVNQIRLCPGDTQEEVVKYCRELGILLEAYSPLGTGKIFEVHERQQFGSEVWKKCRANLYSLEFANGIFTIT